MGVKFLLVDYAKSKADVTSYGNPSCVQIVCGMASMHQVKVEGSGASPSFVSNFANCSLCKLHIALLLVVRSIMDAHKFMRMMVPLARRTTGIQAVLRGGVTHPVTPKAVQEFNSSDPFETPYGRIEIDPDDYDHMPFTDTPYNPNRFGEVCIA